ncbi:MAG: 3-phosphoshikimate 1-carboxyvinyltransferase, partial [Chlamydiae bacterium]|nr:3-phosphoshikimate 1-carboxyvinyltransferase [Chlamydiota bacterium]
MANLQIYPSIPKGRIKVPPSKSHTLRALIFAMMAHGESIIEDYLESPDTEAMVDAIQKLGAKVHKY